MFSPYDYDYSACFPSLIHLPFSGSTSQRQALCVSSTAPYLPSLSLPVQLFALILLLVALILAAVGTGLTSWARFETQRNFPDVARQGLNNGLTFKTQVWKRQRGHSGRMPGVHGSVYVLYV